MCGEINPFSKVLSNLPLLLKSLSNFKTKLAISSNFCELLSIKNLDVRATKMEYQKPGILLTQILKIGFRGLSKNVCEETASFRIIQ